VRKWYSVIFIPLIDHDLDRIVFEEEVHDLNTIRYAGTVERSYSIVMWVFCLDVDLASVGNDAENLVSSEDGSGERYLMS
jgi:hypothetical protein